MSSRRWRRRARRRRRRAAAEADPVLARMEPGEPCDVDHLARQSGLGLPALLTHLTELELRGRVARIGAGRFVRLPSPVVT